MSLACLTSRLGLEGTFRLVCLLADCLMYSGSKKTEEWHSEPTAWREEQLFVKLETWRNTA